MFAAVIEFPSCSLSLFDTQNIKQLEILFDYSMDGTQRFKDASKYNVIYSLLCDTMLLTLQL